MAKRKGDWRTPVAGIAALAAIYLGTVLVLILIGVPPKDAFLIGLVL